MNTKLTQIQRFEKYLIANGSISTQHGFASQKLFIADVPKVASDFGKWLKAKHNVYLGIEHKHYTDSNNDTHHYCIYSLPEEYRKEFQNKYAV